MAHHERQIVKTQPRRRPWLRRLGKLTVAAALSVAALWVAVHRVQWLGPMIADGLRAVFGPAAVAWLQDVAYGIQDHVNLWRYDGDAPKTFWEMPEGIGVPAAVPSGDDLEVPPFAPPPFQPPFAEVATGADGIWVPIADARDAHAPVSMYKSVVHPDKRRGFAAVAVVAIDIKAFELHLAAGTKEPASFKVLRSDRPGVVPSEHTDKLVAAFNGGFKATHGHYGMKLGGIEYLPPRDIACTFALYRDGSHHIATWSKMKSDADRTVYYRQTPPCLVEDGEIHQALHYQEYAKGWGATVGGDTIIRRSSVGLDRERKILFYGLGEAMTAQALARGMKAAGAHWVAELDVNYSYPRFLLYEQPDPTKPPIATTALIKAIEFNKYQYVGQASPRDFFYLTRRGDVAATVQESPESSVAAN